MPSIHIPPSETRRWSGPYLGDYYGVLWKTFNVDLDRNEGKMSLARRFERIEDTTEIGANGQWTAFLRTNADCTDRYWALEDGTTLFKTDSASPEDALLPSADWDADAIASTPTKSRDMTIHGNDSRNDSGRNKLFVSLDSGDIAVLNDTGNNAWTASWWQTKHSQQPLSGNVQFRPIQYFPFRKITLVGSDNLVHTISRPSDTQNDTVTFARLTLPKNLNARHIFYTSNRAWILCDHKFGGEGKIVEWDGYSESYNEIYGAYGVSPLSGVDYNGTPIVLNDKGTFLEFSGSGFQPMIRNGQQVAFPIGYGLSLATGTDTSTAVSVYPRGMTVGEDGLIYINTAQANNADLAQANNISERYDAGVWCLNPLSGRLYNKYSLGLYGDSTDYGHKKIVSPGALYWIASNITDRNLLASSRINTTNSVVQTGIWLLESTTSTTGTRGYFVTQFIQSDNIREQWDSLWIRFRRFITAGGQFVVKAKGTRSLCWANRRPLVATITWTSTTTFTLTLAAGDDALAVGDEVEVLSGVNAGILAHITTISGAHAALQTITIDETVKTGTTTSAARFDRWKKIGVISNTSKYEDCLPIGIDSSFIQLKVEMRGVSSEIELSDMILNHEPNIINKK